jgi:hypothetical protein
VAVEVEVLGAERFEVVPNQIRASVGGVQTAQIRPYPVGFYPAQAFDWTQMMNLMMSMIQMVLMLVFVMLPIKMLPTLLESIKA